MSRAHCRIGAYLDELPMNPRHWTIFGVCSAGFLFDALDFQLMALAAPAIAKEWNTNPASIGLVLSAIVLGMLLGTFLFSIVSDRLGRRFGFQVTITIFAVFCGLSAFAQSIEQLAVLRFLTGIGIGGLAPVDTALMTEFMPKSRRGRLIALWALFFPLGGVLAALAARILVPDFGWRALFLVGVTPAFLILFIRLMIPESPRFLLTVGKMNEARRSAEWLSMKPLPASVADDLKSSDQAAWSRQTDASDKPSLKKLFSPNYRSRTIMLWLLWFFWSFSYFGLLLWLPSLLARYHSFARADVLTYVMGFMIAGIAGRIVVASLMPRGHPCKTVHGVRSHRIGVALLSLAFEPRDSANSLSWRAGLFSTWVRTTPRKLKYGYRGEVL
jgi:putative MFS transporter